MLGWAPTEKHEHFDNDGNRTGFTIVTREPRFTDAERHHLLSKLEHDVEVCSGCGVHQSLIESDDLLLSPADRVCPLCAVKERHARVLADEDEKREKAARDRPAADPRPSDGRHVYISIRPARSIEEG